MSPATHRRLSWAALALLLALHVGWRPRGTELYFGWLPAEVLARLVWMGLALLFLAHLAWRAWPPAEAGEQEREP